MKILYIVPFVPWEVRVRSFNLIPRLARKHEIYLLCVSDAAPTETQEEWLSRYCEEVIHVKHSRWNGALNCARVLPTKTPLRMAYCKSRTASDAVRRLCRRIRPDVLYVERWRPLAFVPENLEVPIVCDPTDSMTLYNRRLKSAGSWWERLIGWEEFKKFSNCEGKLAKRANVCVFCSKVDLDCVREQVPQARYEIVPNGVDCEKFRFKDESEEEPATIIFTGSFNYGPNRHAASYFLDEILPLIQTSVPAAKFWAVGNGATRAMARYRGRVGFETVGFVSDLRSYIAKATVAVAPLTVGSGVSNKLGEGFAVGTAVVATHLACGDLPVENGRELLVANNAKEFAEHCVMLIKSQRLRRDMAERARRFVEQQYDWETVSEKMEYVMQRVAECSFNRANERTALMAQSIASL